MSTTYEELYKQGQIKANKMWAKLPLNEVIKAARKINDDLSIDPEVFGWTLTYLESAMNESEFVAFCESL